MTWIFLVIGLAAGVLSGLFGIGGGVVIVPALLLLGRLPMITATGTSLAALLLPVGALGAWEYYRHGHLNIPAAALIALGLFLGAWFGARLAQDVSGPTLRRLFALFMVAVAIRLWLGAGDADRRDAPRTSPSPAAVDSPAPNDPLASPTRCEPGR
jgi:uncharacterized protein